MADITYTVNDELPENIVGFEQFSDSDKQLITNYQINNLFDSTKHTVELHILSLTDEILESHYNYAGYKLLATAQSAGKEGASILTVDPVQDSKTYGYGAGGVKLLYHFVNNLYSTDTSNVSHYIESISPDRTELRLQTLQLTTQQLTTYTDDIKNKLNTTSYFNEFRLNFGDNDLFIGTNIDTVDLNEGKAVVVKLYEPLPTIYDLKANVSIVEIISDSVAFEVESTIVEQEVMPPTLRSPNFNLEVADQYVVPTQYYNYNELFSYPVNNTNNQVYSLFNEKGVELSIDHSDYSDFIQFSSAQERLMNFRYKVQLLENYSASLAQAKGTGTQSVGVTGSVQYVEGLITGIVSNFDHYERYLYYESASTAWPKTNSTAPYTNASSATNTAINWYANQLTQATRFDASNFNALVNSIPSYLRDDPSNDNYTVFVHMIGQHFDNLWMYGKAVTDKYDNDNRLNFGISKDLVAEALTNFGVKLYTSNNSIQDLFSSLVGQSYQSGSETITNYITGSLSGSNTPIQPSSFDNYNKEIHKRIYHNLPYLLKTKGTERGLRALINCFGIPADILTINLYGGRDTTKLPFLGDYQYTTSSLDKIRLDNTGSIVAGNTLSGLTSIVRRDNKYTDDLHQIEVGFSPTTAIDNYITSNIGSTFNIDDYIGDPQDLASGSYTGLYNAAKSVLNVSGSNMQDYVRLIKFFDNTIFKMVKDFIPARAVADTGIIIKPNTLNRSKAKSVIATGMQLEYSGSIDTAFYTGTNAGTFGSRDQYTTSYIDTIQTPIGLANYIPNTVDSTRSRQTTTVQIDTNFNHAGEQAKFNGELQGAYSEVSNGEWNQANPYKVVELDAHQYGIRLWSSSAAVCSLTAASSPVYVANTDNQQIGTFFTGVTNTTTFTAQANGGDTIPITFPRSFSNYYQYDSIKIVATNPDALNCTDNITAIYGLCNISIVPNPPTIVATLQLYNLKDWFNIGQDNTMLDYYVGGTQVSPNQFTNYTFSQIEGAQVVLKIVDIGLNNCSQQVTVTVQTNDIQPKYTNQILYYGLSFNNSYSYMEGESEYTTSEENLTILQYASPPNFPTVYDPTVYSAPTHVVSDYDVYTGGIATYFTPQQTTTFNSHTIIHNKQNIEYNVYIVYPNTTGDSYTAYLYGPNLGSNPYTYTQDIDSIYTPVYIQHSPNNTYPGFFVIQAYAREIPSIKRTVVIYPYNIYKLQQDPTYLATTGGTATIYSTSDTLIIPPSAP